MSGVRVRVPATTANIGPGFDCLGCALGLYANFECEITGGGLEITGCPEAFRNEDNLFVQAFRLAEREIGAHSAGLRLNIQTDVPVSRGLGSSASLLAGGVAAANLKEYASAPFVCAVGGSWVCPKKEIAAGNFAAVEELCREARKIVDA